MKKSQAQQIEKTEKRMLPVQFTEPELQAIGLQLAATHQRIDALTDQKKAAADRFKDDIDAASNEAGRLAANRINGWENRYVDCTTTYDFNRSTKRTVRLDTGEIVEEGPMSDDELLLAQKVIDFAAEQKPATE